LNLPCLVCVKTKEDDYRFLEMVTTNIGIGGAYLPTANPLHPGTAVSLELVVNRRDLWGDTGKAMCITIAAEVCRMDEAGMAVCFNHHYQIMRMTCLIRLSKERTQWIQGFDRFWRMPPNPSEAVICKTR
jgi:hypothetical protein